MTEITPYAEDAGSVEIGGLTVESGSSLLSLYGSLDIGRDRAGLALALRLKAVLDAAVATLQAQADLPEAARHRPPGRRPNPFA
jgi:hypothetical protein